MFKETLSNAGAVGHDTRMLTNYLVKGGMWSLHRSLSGINVIQTFTDLLVEYLFHLTDMRKRQLHEAESYLRSYDSSAGQTIPRILHHPKVPYCDRPSPHPQILLKRSFNFIIPSTPRSSKRSLPGFPTKTQVHSSPPMRATCSAIHANETWPVEIMKLDANFSLFLSLS